MSSLEQPTRLCGATLGEYRHICAFFRNTSEEYDVLIPFMQEGLERGQKAVYIGDPKLHQERLGRLSAAGVDVPAMEKAGQLELRGWDETYLRGGRFDEGEMLAFIPQTLASAREQGFPLTRLAGHGDWIRDNWPGSADFLRYEIKLNQLLAKDRDVILCLYDLSKLGAGVVMDTLRSHPMVILGGVIQVNPFYMPPDEFLRELTERDARARFA
jgi:hypothetical protein